MKHHALIDAGPLIDLFDASSLTHAHYTELIQQDWILTTTWPCVVEACHFLEARASHALLQWVVHGGVTVFPFEPLHLQDMIALMQQYTAWPRTEMDFADATLVWLAAETNVTQVMTLDVRDFSRYRLPDGRGFEIL